jgi:hypothetical protein
MNRKTLRRDTIVWVAAILGGAALMGCTDETETRLIPTAALPAAEGIVTAWADNLDETVVEIDANYLVPANETKDDIYYVVWAEDGGSVTELGTLNLKGRVGKLITKTKLKEFDIIITTEEEPFPQNPVAAPILRSAGPIQVNS